jgi:hypothetical protein
LGKEGLRMQGMQRMYSQTGSVFWITAALSRPAGTEPR